METAEESTSPNQDTAEVIEEHLEENTQEEEAIEATTEGTTVEETEGMTAEVTGVDQEVTESLCLLVDFLSTRLRTGLKISARRTTLTTEESKY